MNSIQEIKVEFPLTFAVLEWLCSGCGSLTEKHKYLWWKDIVVKTKDEVAKDKLITEISEITQPVWSMCEDILNGGGVVTFDKEDSDKITIVVGGKTFNTGFDGWNDKFLRPNILNTTEKRLFLNCVYRYVENRREEEKQTLRKELLSYYEEKSGDE